MSETKAKGRGRPRGRPRAFDPEKALHEARDVFWDAGYAASSLDELSAAMAMNRPSVYAAFGDKEALYLQALEGYRDDGAAAMRAALDPRKPLAEGLREMYAGALELYFSNTPAPRGCFLIGFTWNLPVAAATARKPGTPPHWRWATRSNCRCWPATTCASSSRTTSRRTKRACASTRGGCWPTRSARATTPTSST